MARKTGVFGRVEETAMSAQRRVRLDYPKTLTRRPIIYEIGRTFRVITSIYSANMTAAGGWAIIEVSGPPDEIDRALNWLRDQGIGVTPVDTPTPEPPEPAP